MTNQVTGKTKFKKLYYWVSLVVSVILMCIIFYLVQSYQSERSVFSANENRDTEVASKEQWAAKLELAGVPNFHKVSDDLYRGAQPTKEGFIQLKKLGIKTIVNLRSFHSDTDEMEDTGLSYEHIYMKAWHPEKKEIIRFLQIVNDKNRTPVFVHCQHGADRTGTMCAVYRIAIQGWSKQQAIEEMTKGGFGYHQIWKNLNRFLEGLDIDEIKREAGLQ